MTLKRRQLLFAAVGLTVTGCKSSSSQLATSGVVLPGPHWSSDISSPHRSATSLPARIAVPAGIQRRSQWTTAKPNTRSINAMGSVGRITIHHEGYKAVWFTDVSSTRARIELIRRSHRNKGWSDIGYHYIIDRGGRIWEARPIRYQGAHVRNNNSHNIGVMVLGNFEIQRPSSAQLTRLPQFISQLRKQHRVSMSNIRTHKEIAATSCPGRNLQPHVLRMRSQKLFA